MDHVDEPTLSEGRGPSRRTVVRSAAHAAWMVPAISLATQAPALAVSNHTLTVSGVAGTRANKGANGPTGLTVAFSIKNNAGSAATGLVATVVVNDGAGTLTAPANPAGWTITPTGAQNSPTTYTITYTGTGGSLAAGATASFSASFTSSLAGKDMAGTISVTANATGFPPASGSGAIA